METPRIIVVTGASRGLGRAATHRLAIEGHQVVATARHVEDLAPLREELEILGHRIDCQPLDVTDDASVAALALWLEGHFDRVDGLINNAGIAVDGWDTGILELPLDKLRTTLETNLYGALRVTQAVMPLLRRSAAGRVVNLSSGMGQLADMGAGSPAYRISKTALNALTRILAAELRDTPIKVNAVCPGWCRTDMGGRKATRSPEEGIDTVVWLVTIPKTGPTGGFFRDRKPIPW
ncbi:MAG: short-chain dehydrogenase/reductase [Rhodocyclaceae bacterium]|nr:short-chain dehydrogenase/reductase [Rhodocyclaceae bacterium]